MEHCMKYELVSIKLVSIYTFSVTIYSKIETDKEKKDMEAKQGVLHMNKGEGDDSYAKNSALQLKVMLVANSMIEEAVKELISDKNISKESFGIADLGCSSGPNTLIVISKIIDSINAACHLAGLAPPELRVSLNDLFANDFNGIFQSLPAFYDKLDDENAVSKNKCFVSGVPGSFYGRLFAKGSLHFVHSSSSLHWRSQVPRALQLQSDGTSALVNKGKIQLSVTSPPCVVEAFLSQFQIDFSMFLKSRSEEMVTGGRMVLNILGRRSGVPPTDENACFPWEPYSEVLMSMASESLIEEEKIDSFNLPCYAPSPEELKHVVQTEGSFNITRIEIFETDWDKIAQEQMTEGNRLSMSPGELMGKLTRAVIEPIFESHFGKEVMDEIFLRYGKNVDNHFSKKKFQLTCLIVALCKKG